MYRCLWVSQPGNWHGRVDSFGAGDSGAGGGEEVLVLVQLNLSGKSLHLYSLIYEVGIQASSILYHTVVDAMKALEMQNMLASNLRTK